MLLIFFSFVLFVFVFWPLHSLSFSRARILFGKHCATSIYTEALENAIYALQSPRKISASVCSSHTHCVCISCIFFLTVFYPFHLWHLSFAISAHIILKFDIKSVSVVVAASSTVFFDFVFIVSFWIFFVGFIAFICLIFLLILVPCTCSLRSILCNSCFFSKLSVWLFLFVVCNLWSDAENHPMSVVCLCVCKNARARARLCMWYFRQCKTFARHLTKPKTRSRKKAAAATREKNLWLK